MNSETLLVTGTGAVTTWAAWSQLSDLQQVCERESVCVKNGRLHYSPRCPLHEDVQFAIGCVEAEMVALLQDASEQVVH